MESAAKTLQSGCKHITGEPRNTTFDDGLKNLNQPSLTLDADLYQVVRQWKEGDFAKYCLSVETVYSKTELETRTKIHALTKFDLQHDPGLIRCIIYKCHFQD